MKKLLTRKKESFSGSFMRRLVFLGLCLATVTVYGQNNQKITVVANNESLEQIFTKIQDQTDFLFLYSHDEIDVSRKISLNRKDATVHQVMDAIASAAGISYSIKNRHIVLSNVKDAQQPAAANTIVSGRVTAGNGSPVIGASIVVAGTSKGSSSDIDGRFSIEAGNGDVLQVRYLGFEPQDVNVGNRSVVEIVLTSEDYVVDNVVVTALGIRKEEKSLSYNIQQISANDIGIVADPSFVNNLNGKVVGVTINSSSSGVGGGSRVVMRGSKSIAGNNNALYVIDGIPMPDLRHEQLNDLYSGAGQTGDGLANINPEDIESISVLSGPSAAALYGSSAANGVILITTKKGAADKLSISVSSNTTFSKPLILPRLQTTYGQTEFGSYEGWGEKLTVPSSYNVSDFFQTGVNTTNSVSLSTGTERNQTFASVGAVNASGIVHNNDYSRYNFNVRNTSKFLNDKVTLDLGYMASRINEQNMTAQGQYFNPLIPLYLFPAGDDFDKVKAFERFDVARNFKTQFWPYGDQGLAMQNPYWITERNLFVNTKSRNMVNATLSFDINDWLTLSGRAKLDDSNERHERKLYASTIDLFASTTGYYSLNQVATRQTYGDVLLNVDKYLFDNNFGIIANIGASIEDITYDQNMYGGKLLGVPNLFTFSNVNSTLAESSMSGYHRQKQSVFASAQFGFRSMVYLDVTARNDWASTLAGSNVKSFFYPTVGLSGIVTDIFDIRSNTLSFLKLRVSYSEVGNEPEPFLTIPTYALANGYPVTQTRMPNPGLEPERTKSWETGVNLAMFNSALKLDVTLYKSSTYNQFFEPTLSSTSDYTSVILNAGRIDNKGIEAMLRYDADFGQLKWGSYVTYSANRNEIKELLYNWQNPETGELISLNELDMGGTSMYKMKLVKGGSMGDIYVNTLKTDEHGAIYVHPNTQTVVAEPNKFVYAGNSNPDHSLGWGNDFHWNGISMGFLFTARIGGIVVSNTQAVLDAFGASQTTADARENGGAIVNGRPVPTKEYYQTIGGGASGGIGSMYCYSATNVRLSELSLGYNIPVSKITNDVVKSLNVSFVGRNLFFLYNKAPYDPELTASTGTYFQGIDYFMMPSLRNLGFSVRLTF